jgi:septal ring factor EnvC (AmiA/AmiB activator)
MDVVLAILIGLVALGVALWLAYTAQSQVRQLRTELDQTQSQLNDTRQQVTETRQELSDVRQELNELKAAAEVIPPPPPPLPRARSGGLDDLREQLRAAHREDEPSEE